MASGVIVSGDIVDYNDSDNVISISHMGSDDSDFHEFVTSRVITSADSDGNIVRRMVTAVNEQLNAPGAQNEDFSDNTNFIDFSESNPFGTVEGN